MYTEKVIYKIVYPKVDGTEEVIELNAQGFTEFVRSIALNTLLDNDFVTEVYTIIEEDGERGPSSPFGYLSKKGLVFTDEFD